MFRIRVWSSRIKCMNRRKTHPPIRSIRDINSCNSPIIFPVTIHITRFITRVSKVESMVLLSSRPRSRFKKKPPLPHLPPSFRIHHFLIIFSFTPFVPFATSPRLHQRYSQYPTIKTQPRMRISRVAEDIYHYLKTFIVFANVRTRSSRFSGFPRKSEPTRPKNPSFGKQCPLYQH